MICVTFADALSQFRQVQPDRSKLKIDVQEQHIELTFGKKQRTLTLVDSIGSLFYRDAVNKQVNELRLHFQ